MAERTPVVKKYRDALETVIGATMEFLARVPPSNPNPNPNQDPTLTSTSQSHNPAVETPQQSHPDTSNNVTEFSPGFVDAAQESYDRGPQKAATAPLGTGATDGTSFNSELENGVNDVFGYMPELQTSPAPPGRWEGRHGEMGQMDAEWLLSLCEGDGFSLSMLNEMMRFEPSLGA
jgi:hypothetical protein